MLKFFPKYTNKGASSRYRIYQYQDYFRHYNCVINPFFDENYIPALSYRNIKGLLYLSKLYLKQLKKMCLLKPSDVVFVQYEFTPFLPFNTLFFKLFKIKYIVDFDDAAFHGYDQHKSRVVRGLFKSKIATVIKHATHVVTGSPYLTSYALKYNKNVTEIPTSIDFSKYKIRELELNNDKIVIGWIGSKTTSKNLLELIPTFNKLQEEGVNFELRFIGFNTALVKEFDKLPLTIVNWTNDTEVEEIQKFTVGIMPLEENPFNKGKCAFKLIQYMACAIPTISTPFESNIKVDRGNGNLFAANNDEWFLAIKKIKANAEVFRGIGLNNRNVIEKHYSIQANYSSYINIFKTIKMI